MGKLLNATLAACAVICLSTQSVWAQNDSVEIPNFIGEAGQTTPLNVEPLGSLRFLTTLDFPPFNYLDGSNRLTGFNIYLAKAICAEMGIRSTCTIQALPFAELAPALILGRGDAIISGYAANDKTRAEFAFSKSYLRFPGRFVKLRANTDAFKFDDGLQDIKIGVVSGSGQEKLLRSYFQDATIIGFTTEQLLAAELNAGKLDLMFGDGMSLSFWLNGSTSLACCVFVGSPYYAQNTLGEGMRIAALNSRTEVISAINKSLEAIQKKRGLTEYFLRFFPYNFY